ncbi:MAG: Galactonate dehydratase, partial [uncultured Chloroflexi bacterium]
ELAAVGAVRHHRRGVRAAADRGRATPGGARLERHPYRHRGGVRQQVAVPALRRAGNHELRAGRHLQRGRLHRGDEGGGLVRGALHRPDAHNPLGPICAAASVHLGAAVPNFAWMEVGAAL